MSSWTKLPAVEPEPNPCLHCPDPKQVLSLEKHICVGFGDAHLERDGQYVWDENTAMREGKDFDEMMTVLQAEELAAKDPDHDWRIVLHGPLHGETYQRHDTNTWICVEKNEGFA